MDKRIDIIDPHLHLFDLKQGEYAWFKRLPSQDANIIAKSFTPDDLELPQSFNLKGFVHIEAGFDNQQPWREIDYLEKAYGVSTDGHQYPAFKTIACINLMQAPDDFTRQLKQLNKRQTCVGVRHILDGQAAEILSHPNSMDNLKALIEHDYIFELQVSLNDANTNQLLLSVLKSLPRLKIALNHAGFMPIDELSHDFNQCVMALEGLAELDNVYVKYSGLEMVSRTYTDENYRRLLAHIINIFGDSKVMIASNFPLTLYVHGYETYWTKALQALEGLDIDASKLCATNATDFYGF